MFFDILMDYFVVYLEIGQIFIEPFPCPRLCWHCDKAMSDISRGEHCSVYHDVIPLELIFHHRNGVQWNGDLKIVFVATTEYQKLCCLWRIKAYLSHGLGSWEVQDNSPASGESQFAASSHDCGYHIVRQTTHGNSGLSSSFKAIVEVQPHDLI
jgi:hypothetical protein